MIFFTKNPNLKKNVLGCGGGEGRGGGGGREISEFFNKDSKSDKSGKK